jgi:MerR family redox-sensitive transcriptional activator SoxR
MQKRLPTLSIGEVSARTGLAVSAIRYYVDQGLVDAIRGPGGNRRFMRADIRRISFILIAQRLGFSLADIRSKLALLPAGRTPTKPDWQQLSAGMRNELDDKIAMLQRLRDRLDGCIGCGCLSLETCALYNADDAVFARGAGPRLLLESSIVVSPPSADAGL